MLIIDEVEMALHPRAQVKLLTYLITQADLKHFTVIFSTHSVTLLKAIDHSKIIYLENDGNGVICPIYGCFPTYALGNIASKEEALPDAVAYVEDLFARDILSAMFDKRINEKFVNPSLRPTVKVLPVGGFKEVVAFMGQNRAVLPDHCGQHSFLDADVSAETLQQWQANGNHARLRDFQRFQDQIHFLPWTPEVGIRELIRTRRNDFQMALRERFSDNQIHLNDPQFTRLPAANESERRAAKRSVDALLNYLCARTGRDWDWTREEVCRQFVEFEYAGLRQEMIPILDATFRPN